MKAHEFTKQEWDNMTTDEKWEFARITSDGKRYQAGHQPHHSNFHFIECIEAAKDGTLSRKVLESFPTSPRGCNCRSVLEGHIN